MGKKSKKRLLIIIGIIVGLIILGGMAIFFFPAPDTGVSPIVTIHFPSYGQSVTLGEALNVQSSARDDTELITKLELWSVKDGVFTLIEQSTLTEGDHLVSMSHGWLPSTLGPHQLIARAFSESGKHGEAAVTLTVVETQEESDLAESSQEVLTLPEGGYIGEESGDESDEPEEQPPPEMEVEFEPSLFLSQAFFPLIWDPFIPDLDLADVQIEALSFEVQEPYVGVYCYVSLEEYPTERIPASGYFETPDQVHWNIEEYLGGNNAVTIPILMDQPLDMHLECEGVKDNNQTVSLGQLNATHPAEDWNGQIFQAASTGGEGFSIAYRINPVISDLVPPTQLHLAGLNQQSYFHWLWAGIVGEIEGFRIYRDGMLVADMPADSLLYPVPESWMQPLCGDEYAYQVTAYRGSEESAPSNQLIFQGAACNINNDITNVSYQSTCEGSANKFKVKYMYGQLFGKANIGIQIYKDGEMLPDFYSTHPSIPFGHGTALATVMFQGTAPVTSDQVVVTMINNQGQVFYDEIFDMEISWYPGSVDLSITSVDVDLENSKFRARVRNNGCAMALPSDLVIVRESDGWTGFLNVPQIGANDSSIASMDTLPGEAVKWAGEINLTIDPLDNISESNESNNEYHLGSTRVKNIQFYKIHIDNDHDKYSKGEWNLYFEVSRFTNGIWEVPQEVGVHHTWGEGDHGLSNSIDLNLSADDSLLIIVHGYEDDFIASKYGTMGAVAVYFSPDSNPVPGVEVLQTMTWNYAKGFTHLGSWETGGDYAIESDMGDYTIYFRIILER